MKLASLLAQYLHEHHRLDLPGIGTFQFTPGSGSEEEPRRAKQQASGSVSFESNAAIKDNPGLISFVSSHTGKIKALAAADIDSHLELAKQFLNIGKPFLFDGIGTLVKIRSGEYGFVSADVNIEKGKGLPAKEMSSAKTYDNAAGEYSGMLMPKKEKMNWQKPAIFLLILAGIGLAVWGGYTVYKITTAKNKNNNITVPPQTNTPSDRADNPEVKPETSLTKTIQPLAPLNDTLARNFKVIVEVADSARALKRYNNLLTKGVKEIKMETKDSLTYKLFFIVLSKPSDTASILLQYKNNYTPSGKTAFIEN